MIELEIHFFKTKKKKKKRTKHIKKTNVKDVRGKLKWADDKEKNEIGKKKKQ